ncbi:MAG: hypothetical protein QOE08_59 [Thermoleophilaceae bacterium]|jgi:predicted lipid-binding transport protein (Tim44 family)|nr:hypothetical protein [Thermoleophilaceae bacterium]
MARKDDDTAETDAVVIEGTVDNPPTGDAPSTSPPPTPAAGGSYGGTSPAAADRASAEAADTFSERPELFVAGAFVGGIVLAKLIGAFTGDDD